MRFSPEEQAAFLDSPLFEDVMVASVGYPLKGMFCSHGEILDEMGRVITTVPTVIMTDIDIDSAGIVGGESGTAMTIDGIDYVVLSVVPKGDGFSTLTLEKS